MKLLKILENEMKIKKAHQLQTHILSILNRYKITFQKTHNKILHSIKEETTKTTLFTVKCAYR